MARAIGFDGKRGDQIEVVNLRFADAPQAIEGAAAEGLLAQFMPTRHDLMRYVELVVLLILTLVVAPILKAIGIHANVMQLFLGLNLMAASVPLGSHRAFEHRSRRGWFKRGLLVVGSCRQLRRLPGPERD